MTCTAFLRLTWAASSLLGLAPPTALAQCRYTWTEIPQWQTPSGPLFPRVTGMNNVGQVVGYYDGVGGETSTGFVWSEAEGVRLMPRPAGYAIVQPADINDLGEVVGSAEDSTHHFAFYWNGGSTYLDLGFPPGGNMADAYAINNRGQIVGSWGETVTTGWWHAVLWENGVGTDLTDRLSSPSSFCYDINEHGLATGALDYWPVWDENRAFVLDVGQVFTLPPAPGCVTSDGRSINDQADVSGRGGSGPPSDPNFHYCGFVWLNQQMYSIPRRFGQRHVSVTDLNSAGVAVGVWENPGGIGFVWQDGVARRLAGLINNGPPSTSHDPFAIDSNGRIATVIGLRAALLTPIPQVGDANGDCIVDIRDLAVVLSTFGCQGAACEGDVDLDGVVGLADLATLLINFGN